MIMQIVKLKSLLSEDELMGIAQDRAPQFRALPGLLQKYYVKMGEPNQHGGVYVWDSRESLMAYRESELAATIASAYKVTEPPQIELYDVMFQLRD